MRNIAYFSTFEFCQSFLNGLITDIPLYGQFTINAQHSNVNHILSLTDQKPLLESDTKL